MTSDFLATSFGTFLKPTLESLYPRPVPGQRFDARPDMGGLLKAIAQHALPILSASQQLRTSPVTKTQGLVQTCADVVSFKLLIESRKAVVVLSKDGNDEHYHMAEVTLEDLAKEKLGIDVVFLKLDSKRAVTNDHAASIPTFLFFANGRKVCGIEDVAPDLF